MLSRLRFSRVLVYGLLSLGALVFCWPLLWMIGTSIKADKELFAGTPHFWPEAPLAQQRSPYADPRAFEALQEGRHAGLLRALESYAASLKEANSTDLDRPTVIKELALGILGRLQDLMPPAQWSQPAPQLAASAIALVDAPMIADLLQQIRRSLLIGQLRARSYDLQEDRLVAAPDAAKAWEVEGASLRPASDSKQAFGELHYDLRPGQEIRLSQTFTLSFPVERLYRLQLSLQADESWHPLKLLLEKQGSLYEAVRSTPMADANWSVCTWQEPGPDDLTNKIRDWVTLKKLDSGPAYENGPNKVKVVLVWGSVNAFWAWAYKIRRNYLLVFDNMPFWRYASTSVLLVFLNLVGTLLSSSMVAFSFARLRWPGRQMSYALMLGTMMVPAQVTMIPFFLIVRWLDWYNTLYPLWVCSFFAGAFNVFLLHQFFNGIPTDLEDAAKIDGCGPLRTYWHIMLPLIRPALATIAIFTFMGVWNDFMGPLIYLSDQRLYPLSLGLYALNVQAGGSMSMMMAGSLLMLLPVVLIFFFAQRYFIEGITMTGIKG